jgi:GNAT superfamily N-acetyltransferase
MAGYEGHRGWINYLAVAPIMQRQGLGQLLMEEVETRLAAVGLSQDQLADSHVQQRGHHLLPEHRLRGG